MRIIITGGTGLIGRALAASFVKDGHEVIVLSRNPAQAKGMPAGIRIEQWDAKTAKGWESLADGADVFVNLAGESIGEGRWSEERKRRMVDSRLNAGKAVTEAVEAASQKPAVVVQSSAVGYYGPRGSEVITEESPPGNDFLAKLCVEWERSTEALEAHGVRRPIIRTGLVLSTEGGALPRILLPFKLFVGGKIGSGQQYWPWIHLDDEVAAIRFLIDNDQARGPFNLTAPNPLTSEQFGKVVGQVMGRPSFMPAPAFALKLALGDQSTVVLEGQRAVPQRLQELGFTFLYPEATEALRDVTK